MGGNDWLKRFCRRNNNLSLQLYFPEEEDHGSVKRNDIVMTLPPPTPISTTKRLASLFKFSTDLSKHELQEDSAIAWFRAS